MDQERRKFLRGMAAACATGIAHNFKIGATLIAGGAAAAGTAASAASTTSAAAAVGAGAVAVAAKAYGTGVRAQVFEVIVRQAIAALRGKKSVKDRCKLTRSVQTTSKERYFAGNFCCMICRKLTANVRIVGSEDFENFAKQG